jgi:hypothetical protein
MRAARPALPRMMCLSTRRLSPLSQGFPNVGPDLEAQAAGSMQCSSLLRGLLT